MSNVSPFCLKYTDENYVTKQGFFAALGSSLVEKLWDNVVSYRLSYSARTRLRTISQLPFTLTLTDALKAKFNAFESKLHAVRAELESLESMPEEHTKAERACLLQSLRLAAELENVKLTEPTLRAMLSDIYRGGNEEQTVIVGYRDVLQQKTATAIPDCETFFADVYSAISGTEELVTFYRVNDATVNQGRAGEYAKFNDIESLEANLEEFVFSDPLPPFLKAFMAMYFVDYVQPFASHNPLLGVALAKKLLSQGSLGKFAFLLPLEKVFLKNPKLGALFEETAKTGDFTYVMLGMIDTLNPAVEAMLNDIVKIRTDALKREFRGAPHEEEVPIAEAPSPVDSPAPIAPSPVPVAPAPMPVREPEPETRPAPEVIPVSNDPLPQEAPKKRAPMEEVPILESFPEGARNAFGPRVSLSDKEVKMAARYIVETHPDISKQQALFFASHCTAGRYYTIQDYKRTMKVAYETARTSMDRLAMAKLYTKLRIKNKYVYTLRKAGEKE